MNSIFRSRTLIFSSLLMSLALMSASAQQTTTPQKPNNHDEQHAIFGYTFGHQSVGSPSQALIEAQRKGSEAVNRGEALMKTGDLAAAISAYQEGLSFDPKNGLAYQRLAEAQTAAGKLTDAAATYRKLLYWWPGKDWTNSQNGDASVSMRFALLLQRLHLPGEALSVYQTGWHTLPTDRGPLPLLFTTPDFANADFEAAADTAIGLWNCAWSDPNGGQADFERAIAEQPNLAAPYFYQGKILKYKPGRGADAVASFVEAERLGGLEMKPFVDKELVGGMPEFTQAVKRSPLATP